MTFDDFLLRFQDPHIGTLKKLHEYLVATGANIGDVLRGEVKPSPKPDLSELRELAKQMDTMVHQSAAWPESQEAYAWCAEMLTAALDRLDALTAVLDRLEGK